MKKGKINKGKLQMICSGVCFALSVLLFVGTSFAYFSDTKIEEKSSLILPPLAIWYDGTRWSEGVDIGIYPEGTRSKTGKLLRFKPGACYLAQEANAPIVVMTTQGTEKISKRFLLTPVRVELDIVEVIDRETVQNTSQNDLMAHIRETVENNLPREVEN